MSDRALMIMISQQLWEFMDQSSTSTSFFLTLFASFAKLQGVITNPPRAVRVQRLYLAGSTKPVKSFTRTENYHGESQRDLFSQGIHKPEWKGSVSDV